MSTQHPKDRGFLCGCCYRCSIAVVVHACFSSCCELKKFIYYFSLLTNGTARHGHDRSCSNRRDRTSRNISRSISPVDWATATTGEVLFCHIFLAYFYFYCVSPFHPWDDITLCLVCL
jgi:hypothetical protein